MNSALPTQPFGFGFGLGLATLWRRLTALWRQHKRSRSGGLELACALLLGLALGLGLTGKAQADTYPSKPIRVIIPAGAGDSCDTLVRVLGPKVSERIGQPFVLDNRPGSSGQLGLSLIKQATPDGYTLGCGQGGNMVIVPLVYQKVPYDTKRDFAPIALLASNFLALIVGPHVPYKTTEELIAFAKKNPGRLTFGTNGEGPHASIRWSWRLFARDHHPRARPCLRHG